MGRKQKLKAEKAKGNDASLQGNLFEATGLSGASNDALSDCKKAMQKFIMGDRSEFIVRRSQLMLACSVNKVARAVCNLPSYLRH